MTSYPVNKTPQHSRLNPWLIRLPVLFITGCILLVLLLVIFVGIVQMQFGSKILPSVWVGRVNVGSMTRDDAAAALTQAFSYDKDAVFTFRDGDKFWQFTAGDLGVSLDVDATVDQAISAGHDSNVIFNLVEQASIWFNGRSISPIIRYDQNVAAARLLEIAREINRPAVDATLDINGLFVTATPGSSGRMVDVPAMLTQLDAVILRMDTGGEIPLMIKESLPLVWDTETAAAKARAAISTSVTLVADNPDGPPLGPWSATPDQIAALLTVEPVYNTDGTMTYDVGINVNAFRSFLENLAPGLITQPQNARFHFNDDTRQLEVFEPGTNGRSLNVDQTLTRLETAIFSTDVNARQVSMAFNYTLSPYHEGITAAELGITEMVSQATTFYTGSTQNRINNVIEAAQRFDGLIIAPGEEFSFNTLLGNISPEEGFAEGFVIYGDRTIKGVGGGVCQVSTTVFQAAFYAGFPMTEWHSHGYRVGYYEKGEGMGMDAAIYQGDPTLGEASLDFKFINDTSYHLLIETSIFPADQSVQFRFYSTNPGRQVVKQGPTVSNVLAPRETTYVGNADIGLGQERWVDWPAEGAYVVVTREILDANGQVTRRDDFKRQYAPWGAVIQVNPSDSRLSQTTG
jgi:vancomycin resistance protein YoaR